MYAILGVTKVLEDVEISQRNRPLYDGMRHFLEQDFAKIHEDDSQIIRKFKDHFTARIDIRFMTTAGDFQILSCSDEKAT
ncbi:MAG: hypothetical protein II968_08590, partial [Selenomonadaceae bacterium]|nr:hypothetical protein [Selenomonadaceae bacterium]